MCFCQQTCCTGHLHVGVAQRVTIETLKCGRTTFLIVSSWVARVPVFQKPPLTSCSNIMAPAHNESIENHQNHLSDRQCDVLIRKLLKNFGQNNPGTRARDLLHLLVMTKHAGRGRIRRVLQCVPPDWSLLKAATFWFSEPASKGPRTQIRRS